MRGCSYLYSPLFAAEDRFARRLAKIARASHQTETQRVAMERLERFPPLRDNAIARHGSLEAYAESLLSEADRQAAREVETKS